MISRGNRLKVNRRRRRKYRILLSFLLLINVGMILAWYWKEIEARVPNHIYLFQNQNVKIDLQVPATGSWVEAKDAIVITNGSRKNSGNRTFALDKPITFTASTLGSYQAELKWFGLFHYKYIHFDVIEEAKVMPSGRAVGLYVQSDGIMVLGTSQIDGKDGFSYEPAKDILQPGDTILQVDDKEVTTIEQVIDALQKGDKRKVTLKVSRDKNKLKIKLDKILAQDGQYKIGVWLREDTEGIGTLSFVTDQNQFAALGHGITDVDTGKLIRLNKGRIYPAQIDGIQRGESGSPGELIGSVNLSPTNCIGKIQSNTPLGITGQMTEEHFFYDKTKAYSVGLKQEVKVGKAWILCQLGSSVKKFEITIEKVNVNSRDNKGLVIRVTDSKLLKKSGGIVQGMSGAPILQNNKVIGAVTHVFVNNPARGYATFMENML